MAHGGVVISIILGWLGQSAVAATLIVAAAYLSRRLIEARLTRSVQHEFDTKLTTFKQELREEAQQRESVRNTAFAALLGQRSALAAKRIEAVQSLWEGVLEIRKGIFMAAQLDILKLDAVVAELQDPRMRQYFETTVAGDVVEDAYISRLAKFGTVRPFVSPTAWALFAAYSAIVAAAIAKMKALRLGFDPRKFFKDQHWAGLLPDVLPPEDIDLLGKDADHGLQWAFGRIEERLIVELQRSLGETSAGLESVADAQRILEAAERLEATKIEQRLREGAPAGTLKS
jgi:hypothetical protein